MRAASTNTALLRLAQRIAPPELQIEIIDWIDQLPWANPDLEPNPPEIVQRWWNEVRATDALLVALPEFNWSPAPLAKNAIDWATRPPEDRHIAGTVVAFVSSAGSSGGAKAQENLTLILPFMGATMVAEPTVTLSFLGDRIAPDGTTEDQAIIDAVSGKLAAMVAALRERDAQPAE